MKVFPLKTQFLIIDLENRSAKKALFYIKIDDPDFQHYKSTYS